MRNFILLFVFIASALYTSAQTIIAQSEFVSYIHQNEVDRYEINKVATLDNGSIMTLNIRLKDFILTKWDEKLSKIWEIPVEIEKDETVDGIYPFGKDVIILTHVYNDEIGYQARAFLYSGTEKDKKRELLKSSKFGLHFFNNKFYWHEVSENKKNYMFYSENPLSSQIEKTSLLIDPNIYSNISVELAQNKLLIRAFENVSKDTPDDQVDLIFSFGKFRTSFFLYDIDNQSLKKLNVSLSINIDYKYLLTNDDLYIIQNIWLDKKVTKLNLIKLNINTNKIVSSKEYVLPKIQLLSEHNSSRIFTPLPNGNLLYSLEYRDTGTGTKKMSNSHTSLSSTYYSYEILYSGNINFFIFNPQGDLVSNKIIERSFKSSTIKSQFAHGSSIYVNNSNITFLFSKGGIQHIELTKSDFDGKIISAGRLFSTENMPKERSYLFNSYTTKLNDNTYIFVGIPLTLGTKGEIYKVVIK